ncbi:unnamed protein product, partial [Gordionus sp. m RMFG-2023]
KARSCFSLLEDIEYPFITGGSRYSQSDMDYYFPEEFPVRAFSLSPDMPKNKEKRGKKSS